MKKAAIGTNDLGMHIVIRPISKALLSKDETVGIETQKINSLLTARRPIALAWDTFTFSICSTSFGNLPAFVLITKIVPIGYS